MTSTALAEIPDLRTYLSPREVAEMIPGMTTGNLAQLRFKAQGPRYMRPSKKVIVYDLVDVVEWLESTKRSGTAEAD